MITVWSKKPKSKHRPVTHKRALALHEGLRRAGVESELRFASAWDGRPVPSVASGWPLLWRTCRDANVPFWVVDNAVLGDRKQYADWETTPIRLSFGRPSPRYRESDLDGSRLSKLNVEISKWRPRKGGHVLVCPPAGSLASCYHKIDQEKWLSQVREALPVKLRKRVLVRRKGSPGPLRSALANSMVVVSHSSRVGFDALAFGVPVVETEGTIRDWNGLSPGQIGREDLMKANRTSLFQFVSWTQFLLSEIRSGMAWEASLRLQEVAPKEEVLRGET